MKIFKLRHVDTRTKKVCQVEVDGIEIEQLNELQPGYTFFLCHGVMQRRSTLELDTDFQLFLIAETFNGSVIASARLFHEVIIKAITLLTITPKDYFAKIQQETHDEIVNGNIDPDRIKHL